jgi:hypothetical protein
LTRPAECLTPRCSTSPCRQSRSGACLRSSDNRGRGSRAPALLRLRASRPCRRLPKRVARSDHDECRSRQETCDPRFPMCLRVRTVFAFERRCRRPTSAGSCWCWPLGLPVAGRFSCGRARGDVTEHGCEAIATVSARDDPARALALYVTRTSPPVLAGRVKP